MLFMLLCRSVAVGRGSCLFLLDSRGHVQVYKLCLALLFWKFLFGLEVSVLAVSTFWCNFQCSFFFCVIYLHFSRSKRVLELGSGYGLGGLVIAAVTEASEVVISDGNPQVVNCILIASLNCEHGLAWNVFKHEHVLFFFFFWFCICVMSSKNH